MLELTDKQKKVVRRRRFGGAGFIAFDSVSRPDSTTSAGTASDAGGAWTAEVGTWGVSSGRLYSVSGGNGDHARLGATANGYVQADLTLNAGASNSGLVFREQDSSNTLLFLIGSTNTTSLWSVLAGSFVSMATGTATFTPGVPVTLNVTFNGTSVVCSVGGVQSIAFTLTGGAASLAGTGCGVWNGGAVSTNFWKNYRVHA